MTIFERIARIPQKLKRHRKFSAFQDGILKKTYDDHKSIIDWAKLQTEQFMLKESSSQIAQQGKVLRESVLTKFHNKYQFKKDLRFLIHVPPANLSPAGFSVFSNLADTLAYMGIPCEHLNWDEPISEHLNVFAPTVLLTSDSAEYLDQLDWSAINRYKKDNGLQVGLTASITAYGNRPLIGRLLWAKNNGIDFYYSFRAMEYLQARKDYEAFYEYGYKIYSIEFGANPLICYPVDRIDRDIPFVFLGSSNSDKQERYVEWFSKIFEKYKGFISGPGWKGMDSKIPMNLNRSLYARAQVGINLHLEEQVAWANELNERTYTLAACGVPQLVDNPKLLGARFSDGAMFQANSPKEYFDLFQHMLASPKDAQDKAAVALEEVYAKHTTFHRAEMFINQLFENLV
jgi:hypothetical protein